MVEITLLELHLEESEFTATAPFSPGEKDVEAGGEPPEPDDEGSGAATAVAAVIGLVFLVAVAYLAKRRFLGGDEDEFDGDLDREFDGEA